MTRNSAAAKKKKPDNPIQVLKEATCPTSSAGTDSPYVHHRHRGLWSVVCGRCDGAMVRWCDGAMVLPG